MRIIEYNKEKAFHVLNSWRINDDIIQLDREYQEMREYLVNLYNTIKNEIKDKNKKDYLTDVFFGIGLYDYLKKKDWFNLRIASNDAFWRYLSVAVIPDLISQRWGRQKDDYFWKKSNRIWPKTTWWYVYLSYQSTLEDTKKILISSNLNSDIIQGIVERTGKKGTYVDVYREIILQYSNLDNNTIVKYKKLHAFGSDSLFRAIMRLNTARCLVVEPCLVEGGTKKYVELLISDLIKNI
jgi:hypothetical protein